jgi:hypothetical protein
MRVMDEYIPYEERQQRDREAAVAAACSAKTAQRDAARRANELLATLAGDRTNCYLEILRPVKGLGRLQLGKPRVTRGGLRGGPHFFIAEVLPAYRISGAISGFDAFIAPDGRLWRFAGSGESPNTWQFLHSSCERLDNLAIADFERIAAALEARSPK